MTTGDTYSKSTNTTYTDEEFVIIQNNTVTAVSNTGSQSGTSSTGNATAVSEVNINNGKVSGELKVETNGEEKILKIDKPGNYKLGNEVTGEQGNSFVTTSESKTKQNFSKPDIISNFEKLLDFILGFFKK